MEKVYFELPSVERKKDAIDFINEFHEYNSKINGTGGLDISDYEAWLKRTLDWQKGIGVPEDRVPASTYFLVRESDKRVIGMVNIRHVLNAFLIEHGYGHIGYSVRPTERRKGYATELLRLALIECKTLKISDVYIGCYKDNRGSYRTIEINGGSIIREFQDEDEKWNLEYVINL